MADNLERELMMERELLERELRPRVCYLTKGARGYGFHLHGERSRGAQYIRRIEPGSPAELAGLRSGDRVLQVNGESVDGETHQQVVQRILAVEHRTRLLVVDRVTEEFLKFHGLPCTEEGAIEMGSLSPRSSVASSPRDSNTPPYSRQTSSSSRALSLTSESGNKSPSALERMSNGSPLYKAHARLASPVFLSPASPSELINELKTQPKIDPNMEPNFELITKPNIESNIEPNFEETTEPKIEPNFELKTDPSFEPIMEPNIELITEPISDLSVDFSGSQTSTQEMLEEEEEDVVVAKDLRPRLCHMIVSEQGYGFNLHCDKTRVGQYIRSVDPDSPAEHAGLKPKDRLIEVNGRGIGGLRHAEVVALIRAGGAETCLLVVDPETDELFKTLGITPTSTHLKEDCVDGPIIESPEPDRPPTDSPASSSPVPDAPRISPPIINITLTDSPITNGSPKHLSHGSSSSYSTLSENSVELSSSNISNKVTDSDQNTQDEVRNTKRGAQSDLRPLDPFWESGLNLSLTAAEAKQKARAKKPNKRAPPMDWSKKQEIFSNF